MYKHCCKRESSRLEAHRQGDVLEGDVDAGADEGGRQDEADGSGP